MSKPLKRIPGEQSDDEDVVIEPLPTLTGDDSLHRFLPSGFGRQDVSRNADELYENARRIPLAPNKPKEKKPPPTDSGNEDSNDDDDGSDDDFPISHSIVLQSHSKAISSISLDPSGTRLVTGSHDYTMKLYDFPSMSADHLHAFRSVEPTGSHHVHQATFSHVDSGQSVLVIPATCQAKVYTRDGHEFVEFVKGDVYLRDMHNTKGHVAEITSGAWHPTDANICATASADSTIRIWDVNSKRKHKEIIVHKSRSTKGGRSRMCCLAWTGRAEDSGKSLLASVALDGSLVIYPGGGPYSRPAMEVRDAHEPETWTGGMAFSSDGRLLVTRGQDQCIKLWDTRKLKAPITARTSFPTPIQSEANLIFAPNASSVLTGDIFGNLHVLSPATLSTLSIHQIATSPTSNTPNTTPAITALLWHPKINHLLLGTSTGQVHVLFSPSISTRGAKTVLTNPLRKRHIDDDATLTTDAAAISGDAIIDLASSSQSNKRKQADLRRPGVPQQTPWGKSQPDQEHVRKNIALSSMRDEDPREALLKYAAKAERDPMFTGVWRKNQPNTIYAEIEDEEEDDAGKEKLSDRKKRKW